MLPAGIVCWIMSNVAELPPAQRGTAMMVQNYALFPHLSVAKNFVFSLKMRGFGRAKRREAAAPLWQMAELTTMPRCVAA